MIGTPITGFLDETGEEGGGGVAVEVSAVAMVTVSDSLRER